MEPESNILNTDKLKEDINNNRGIRHDQAPMSKGDISNDHIDREFESMRTADELAQKYQGDFSGAALLKLMQTDRTEFRADQT